MSSKINAEEVINSIIDRYNKTHKDIFDKLFLYEEQLKKERHRHIFSVEDCKKIVMEYSVIPDSNDPSMGYEIVAECLLLLYNWQKTKVVYHMDIKQKNTFDLPEYINPYIIKRFPYPCIFFDYHFKNPTYEGVFVTYYKKRDDLHLDKMLLLGFVEWHSDINLWCIEPIEFCVRNNLSITDSIKRSMTETVNYKFGMSNFLKTLIPHSCLTVKFLSSIIEYYENNSNSNYKYIHKKFARNSKVYDVKTSISSSIYLNNDIIVSKRKNSNKGQILSSPKTPHPRRAHTRTISIKDEDGNIIEYRTIEISATYVHKEENKPTNIKSVYGYNDLQ